MIVDPLLVEVGDVEDESSSSLGVVRVAVLVLEPESDCESEVDWAATYLCNILDVSNEGRPQYVETTYPERSKTRKSFNKSRQRIRLIRGVVLRLREFNKTTILST